MAILLSMVYEDSYKYNELINSATDDINSVILLFR